jgi:hypothetical protein
MQPNAQRKLELELGPIAPWGTYIRVFAVETNHGRKSTLPHDHLFEVTAEWVGPPATGFPPSPIPVSARDVYVVTNLQDATTLAYRAREAFAKGGDEAPDLRELVPPQTDTLLHGPL